MECETKSVTGWFSLCSTSCIISVVSFIYSLCVLGIMMKRAKRTKRLIGMIVAVMVVLTVMPVMPSVVRADPVSVNYIDEDGDEQTVLASELTGTTCEWGNGNWYVVPTGGVTINNRITVQGTVNLILKDGVTLTASKGINVGYSNTLKIYSQSEGTGTLTASGLFWSYQRHGLVISPP